MTEFTENQLRYFQWLETPKEQRTPKTQVEMSKILGVSRVTLREWAIKYKEKDNPPISNELKKFIKELQESTYAKGNPKNFELLGKIKGFLSTNLQEKSLGELTADDYYRIRKEAKERLDKLHRESYPIGDGSQRPPIPPPPIRLSSEPEQSADNKVG